MRISIAFLLVFTALAALHCQVYWSPWTYSYAIGGLPEPKIGRMAAIWVLEYFSVFLLTDPEDTVEARCLDTMLFFMAYGCFLLLLSMLLCFGVFGVPDVERWWRV